MVCCAVHNPVAGGTARALLPMRVCPHANQTHSVSPATHPPVSFPSPCFCLPLFHPPSRAPHTHPYTNHADDTHPPTHTHLFPPSYSKSSSSKAVQPAAHPEQLADNRPWVEKFRPAGLGDLVAHEEIISIRACCSADDAGDWGCVCLCFCVGDRLTPLSSHTHNSPTPRRQ